MELFEFNDKIQGEEGVENIYGFAWWTSWSNLFQRPIGVSTFLVWSEWCPILKETLWIIRKKEPLSRWLACATFPLLISICWDCPTSLSICKKCVNISEVDVSGLGFKVNFRYGGYISWFYIDFNFFVDAMILHEPIKSFSFVAFGVGPQLCLGMSLAKLDISLFVHFLVTKYR
jgi:hypothetical protein